MNEEMVTRKKIMLADDVELFLELEKTFFQRREIDLVVARTGQQAVDLARAEFPDLIYMDLFMPEMNGNLACQQLKQDPHLKSIPIVMVTQGGREEDLDLCRAAGCDEILFKPINRHLFIETARRFINLEPRQAMRVDTRLHLHYGVDPTHFVTDLALNLSERGVFIVSTALKPTGTRLYLEFSLPGCNRILQIQGEVCWLNAPGRIVRPSLPSGMGVAFADVSPEDLEMISEFIKQECLAPSW